MDHNAQPLRDVKRKASANIRERGQLMRYFCDQLNRDRLQSKYTPITMGRMDPRKNSHEGSLLFEARLR